MKKKNFLKSIIGNCLRRKNFIKTPKGIGLDINIGPLTRYSGRMECGIDSLKLYTASCGVSARLQVQDKQTPL
ncbi:MAG: hypothetical protein HQK55_10205 [Deltaproteobacteria bacterium]|nr:hypothetical protein [Deltaproteobacteria bacterium]